MEQGFKYENVLIGYDERDVEHKDEFGNLLCTEHIKEPVYELTKVYFEYTVKERLENQIIDLKNNLKDTDYIAIKFAEGEMSAQEYEPTRQQRINWRIEINQFEELLQTIA